MKDNENFSTIQTQAILTAANHLTILIGEAGDAAMSACHTARQLLQSTDMDEETANMMVSLVMASMANLTNRMVIACNEFISKAVPNAFPTVAAGAIDAVKVICQTQDELNEIVLKGAMTVDEVENMATKLMATAEFAMTTLEMGTTLTAVNKGDVRLN